MEQNKNTLWIALTIIFAGISAILLLSTIIFWSFYTSAEQDFEDQQEVTRLFVQAYDSLNNYEILESEDYLKDAQELQMEIFDRNGMEYSE